MAGGQERSPEERTKRVQTARIVFAFAASLSSHDEDATACVLQAFRSMTPPLVIVAAAPRVRMVTAEETAETLAEEEPEADAERERRA